MHTYTKFIQSLSKNISAFLLIDENDDRWIDTAPQDLHKFVALLVLANHEHDLFSSLHRLTSRSNVH